MRLVQIVLFAHDVARLARFYEQALGLARVDGDPHAGLVRLDAGGCLLALHAARHIAVDDPPVERTETAIKLAFHADDVDAARATLIAAGATMRDPKRFDGITLCDGVDPEGNVFQITTR